MENVVPNGSDRRFRYRKRTVGSKTNLQVELKIIMSFSFLQLKFRSLQYGFYVSVPFSVNSQRDFETTLTKYSTY